MKSFFSTSFCFFILIVSTMIGMSSLSLSSSSPFVSAVTVLSGNLDFTHDWISSSVIEFNMSAPIVAGKYFALAVQPSSSSTGMGSGLGVACAQPASGTTTTTCQAISTASNNAVQRTDASLTLVSASTDATKAYVQVRLDPSLMSLTTSSRRVIFSVGTWSGGVTKHPTPADRGGTIVSFTAPTTTSTTTTEAPTTSSTTTTITTTTSAPVTTGALSTGTYLSGNLGVGYTWNGTRITWTLDTPILSNHYGAVATSPSAMTSGLGVSCLMPTGSSAAACSPISTISYNVAARVDDSLTIDASWTTATRAYVIVTLDAAAMGVTSGSKRCIVAIGNWNGGLPAQHAANAAARSPTTINFVQQTTSTTEAPSTSSTTTTTTSVTSTTTVTTESSTTAAAPVTTAASSSGSYLSGNLGVGYTWIGSRITWTLDTPILSNHYGAVATSPSSMTSGLGISCLMPTASMSASCTPISTTSYNVAARVDDTYTIDASWTTATRAYVIVTLDAAAMGVTSGSKRCIVAIGNWNGGLPAQHATSAAARSPTTINFVQQTTTAAPTTSTVSGAASTTTSAAPGTTSSSSVATTTATPPSTTSTTPTTTAEPATSSTSTPTAAPSADHFVVLNDNARFAVNWTEDGHYLDIMMSTLEDVSSPKYIALAFTTDSSSTGMNNGRGVVCARSVATDSASADVVLISTWNYDVASHSGFPAANWSLLSTSRQDGRDHYTVRVNASFFFNLSSSATTMMIPSIRAIFATGSYDAGSKLPLYHGGVNRGSISFPLYRQDVNRSAAVTTAPTTTQTTASENPANTSTTMAFTGSTGAPATTNADDTFVTNLLSGQMEVGYRWSGGFVYFTLVATKQPNTAEYLAVAWAETSQLGMANARGFACQQPQSSSAPINLTTGVNCVGITTSNYAVAKDTSLQMQVVAASSSQLRASITIAVPESVLPGWTSSSQSLNFRVIYAIGSWASSTTHPQGFPQPHSSANRGAFNVQNMNRYTTTSTTLAPGETTQTTLSTVSSTTTTTSVTTVTDAPQEGSKISVLNNKFDLEWVFSDPNSLDTNGAINSGSLDFTITSRVTDQYLGVSFSASGMAGVGFACIVPSSSASNRKCIDITTVNYAVSQRSVANGGGITIKSASVTPDGWTITASTSTASQYQIKNEDRRVIFATGSWGASSTLPSSHASGSAARTPMMINFLQAGVQSTTPVPPTTTSTPAPPTTTPPPGTKAYSGLGGGLSMQWEFDSNDASSPSPPTNAIGKNITMTITSSQMNVYKAVAWATTGGGMGPAAGFACMVTNSNPSLSGVCRDITTNADYTISRRSSQPTEILSYSAASSGSGWTMKIRTTTSYLNASYKNADGFARLVVASGSWDSSADLPGAHSNDANSRGSPFIDFVSGATGGPAPTNTMWRFKACLGITWCLFVLLGIGGAILRNKHENSGPRTAQFLKGFGVICVLGSYVACLIAAMWDFEEFFVPAPESLYRAFGASICYLFSIILLPTTKLPTIFNIGNFAGSSYERFINLHVLTGIMIFFAALTHFSMMVAVMTKAVPFGDAILVTTGKAPPLYAFIGLICLFLMFITGIFRRKVYALFRYTHLLFPVVLVMFCIHYPLLIAALVPGVMAYIIDFTWRVLTQCWANTQLISVKHDSDCGVTQLKVRVSDDDYEVGPGQFALVTCLSISPIAHPFTIANFDQSKGDLTFYIKNLGGPFTKKFSELAAANKISSISVSRPIGQLGISLNASPVIFLCAAGVGITPILSIATYIGNEIREGNITGIHTVHIIWSVREESLVSMIAPELQRVIGAIELRGMADQGREADDAIANMLSDVSMLRSNQTAVNCTVYQTSGGGGKKKSAMRSAQFEDSSAPNAVVVSSNNNNTDQDLEELLMEAQEEAGVSTPREGNSSNNKSSVPMSRISRISGRPQLDKLFGSSRGEGLAVSVFSCGPGPFMDSVRKTAMDYGCLLHEETFEL